jgi:hypothetical protein
VGIVGHVVEHSVDGHKYEVRTVRIGTGWRVSIWDEKRRIGPVYSVVHQTPPEAEAYAARPALEGLVEIAVGDLDAGRVKSAAP